MPRRTALLWISGNAVAGGGRCGGRPGGRGEGLPPLQSARHLVRIARTEAGRALRTGKRGAGRQPVFSTIFPKEPPAAIVA
jgi:hypothetical protein